MRMARVLTFFLGFLTIWITKVSSQDIYYVGFSSIFGNINDTATKEYYIRGCEQCDFSDSGMYYTHENACNMYVRCISLGLYGWLVHGFVAPPGAVFNDKRVHLENMFLGDGTTPNRRACATVGHPCDTGLGIPVSMNPCEGYQVCENNIMVHKDCPAGTGFNALTQNCDMPCPTRIRDIRFQRCTANPSSSRHYLSFERVKYSDKDVEEDELFNYECLLGYRYQKDGECECQPYNSTAKKCETTYPVYLDYMDDSWRLARNNTPVQDSSFITGNASFVRNAGVDNKFVALFQGNQVLSADKIKGNDLGIYFDMNMTFQSLRSNGQPGLTFPRDRSQNRDFALADNSACDIPASYGCKLVADTDNNGRVVCYVRPETEPQHPNNVEVSSDRLDLRGPVSVYFARDGSEGVLRVIAAGMERSKRVTFPKDVRAVGNACPLSIGAGTRLRYFTGYVFHVNIRKYCGPFM